MALALVLQSTRALPIRSRIAGTSSRGKHRSARPDPCWRRRLANLPRPVRGELPRQVRRRHGVRLGDERVVVDRGDTLDLGPSRAPAAL